MIYVEMLHCLVVRSDAVVSASGLLFFCLCNLVQPSGHYMYRQFNIEQFYVLPTQCIYVFCVDLKTNSDYFTVQH